MLDSISVKNLALIRQADIELCEGLNILSGETGAGKSILIGSVNLCLGAKADKSMIRVFQLKYDYHNIKAILKARAQGKSYEGMLSASGSIDPQKMAAMLSEENFQAMSPAMRKATEEAEEVLARTQDPLYADMAL